MSANFSFIAVGGIHPVWTEYQLEEYRGLGRRSIEEIEAQILLWNEIQNHYENMDY
ncbi:hypothetical protein [Paucibacter sp. KCTC 42545]|uniref:hypothetical protein n=1 Tax=Paucibacter sp. KCTC 42545 TaxID=1768242 RepID=UPI0012E38273|nr:hypothetical protein [Paucibacter sp. KCTC 42545]